MNNPDFIEKAIYISIYVLVLLGLLIISIKILNKGTEVTLIKNQTKQEIQSSPTPLRYVLINRHRGVFDEISYILKKSNSTITQLNPEIFTEYGQSDDKAEKFNELKLAQFICDSFDVAIVGDTIPDSRFLMKRIDQDYGKFI